MIGQFNPVGNHLSSKEFWKKTISKNITFKICEASKMKCSGEMTS
jgi:hypothetical protein